MTANENKKRNILTCNELPSVELKEEKSEKKVRVKISGGEKKLSTSVHDKGFTQQTIKNIAKCRKHARGV